MTSFISSTRARLALVFALAALACAALASTASASYATSCTTYSYRSGGGGCSWQPLYTNGRFGVCSVYRAVNEYGHYGQIWAMTAPCTER
jgi:hypothetical protein